MKNTGAPIYIRVSSEDQALGTSLATQLRDCRAAAVREGFEPGEVFADEGESAKTIAGRPAFLRLLEYVKTERPPAVVVWKIDRLARNNLDAQIVRSKLSSLKCRLISATEPISEDPSGKFMFDVLSAVAEYDNRLRADRCRLGMVAKASAGWWMHTAPYGYKLARGEGDNPTLAPDPEKAPLVEEAFRLAAEGMPQVEISAVMARKGMLSRTGKPLAKQSLLNILSNPVYIGIQASTLAAKRTPGKWPAIVPEELWTKVQGRLRIGKVPRLASGEFPLKTVLECGNCGKRITGSFSRGRGGRYPYYHCPKCGLRVRAAEVEQALRDKVAGLAMQKQTVDSLEQFVKDLMADKFGPSRDAKAKAGKRLAMLEEQLDALVQLHITGGIDRRRYDSKRGDLEWRLLNAKAEFAAFEEKKTDLLQEFHQARQLLLDPGAFWDNATNEARREAFPLFFESLLILRVNKKIGTLALEGSNCPIWYTRRDSNPRPPV